MHQNEKITEMVPSPGVFGLIFSKVAYKLKANN